MKTWNIEALTGYKPFTTFYEDFQLQTYLELPQLKILTDVPLENGNQIISI